MTQVHNEAPVQVLTFQVTGCGGSVSRISAPGLGHRPQLPELVAGAFVLHLPGSEERAGIKVFPGELHNLLGLYPPPVHKLEPFQMDNLQKGNKGEVS